ncbi:MAG: hypothetical protein WC815_16745 [Vicinamibacterales bacterium]|jgi:hypothetical protein
MIFVYWGFYWPPIQEAAPLIAAQIVFAYAFDILTGATHITWGEEIATLLTMPPQMYLFIFLVTPCPSGKTHAVTDG